jgi:glycosyltransferase involved in cell wall biosynthesis
MAGTPATPRPRLILLTQFYDPEPVYKGQAFAQAVQRLGYDVEVVTGFPNYPGGRIYDGFRIRAIQRSARNGIAVTRLALYPSHGRSRIGRALNYLSFFLSAFLYLAVFARRPDLVYAYHPPLTVGLAAAAARLVRRFPVVVDIHDLWPDTLPASGMISNPTVLKLIDRAALWMYRHIQHIILHTDGFRLKLLERGVPAGKLTTVIGWAHEAPLPEGATSRPEAMRDLPGLKLLYAGNIGPAQALDAVLDAAHLLCQNGQSGLVTFVFLGSGVSLDAMKQKAVALALDNVAFLPRVPVAEVSRYLAAADCLLVHLRDDPLFEITLPSKTQASMFAGKPVLMAVRGEAARLIERANAGLTASPQDPESIAVAALALEAMPLPEREALGRNARSYYLRELAMDKGMKKFAAVFENVRRD